MHAVLRVLILLFPAVVLAQQQQDIRVIDGDTLEMPTKNVTGHPKRVSVRLLGVNAPETASAKCPAERLAGEAAKTYIRDRLVLAKRIKVRYYRRDKYGGRVVGSVLLDGKDLGKDLIAGGYAVPYLGGKRVNVWCGG